MTHSNDRIDMVRDIILFSSGVLHISLHYSDNETKIERYRSLRYYWKDSLSHNYHVSTYIIDGESVHPHRVYNPTEILSLNSSIE